MLRFQHERTPRGHRSQVTHGFEHQVLREGNVHFAIQAAGPTLRQQFAVLKRPLFCGRAPFFVHNIAASPRETGVRP